MGCLGVAGENIFSVFRSLHLPLDTQFWTRGFLLVMRSRKAGLPLATRAQKRELCPKRYVSRMTRYEYFLSQNSFIFFGNHFSPRFMLPCHCQPKIYLPFFEVCTYPSIHRFYGHRGFIYCNAISEGISSLSGHVSL